MIESDIVHPSQQGLVGEAARVLATVIPAWTPLLRSPRCAGWWGRLCYLTAVYAQSERDGAEPEFEVGGLNDPRRGGGARVRHPRRGRA